ncbi:PHB depolymerase family esterase [Sphingomonas naphthae]|uniref:PHB depolymerase family esterase n=1 Tax=Sphingomonas naphthae TaxID=1813468 RepID=A0ABY7TG81_9SPHN|nr:PHB depolymerase family esterase [Sphingomonas naphthae]WCT72232.1 PHB depolymerase family esterase [Sphingomonas naphthae]
MTITNISMAEALRLTRSGKLGEATAVLGRSLAGRAPLKPAPAAGPEAIDPATIDIAPDRVTIARRQRTAEAHARPERAAQPASASGRFEERFYAGPAGRLGYRLYRPIHARPGMPLVVMLHGCTQSPEDFARGTRMNALADRHGFLVAYPGQSKAANMQKCWNWFQPGDQQRDRGEPALIAGITREVIAAEQADPTRVYVAGLSAGGAAAAIMGAAYPDLYAAIGVHSGLACGAARDLPSALAAMRGGAAGATTAGGRFVPVITFHGDRDTTVNEANADEIVAAASTMAGVALERRVETGRTAGRAFTRTTATGPDGAILIERWTLHGAGHAWAGGDPAGTYADAAGPDASAEMLRFFLSHRS